MVRTGEMKPYVVLVKPPMYDRLKETRAASYARSTFDQTSTRGFTVSRRVPDSVKPRESGLRLLRENFCCWRVHSGCPVERAQLRVGGRGLLALLAFGVSG